MYRVRSPGSTSVSCVCFACNLRVGNHYHIKRREVLVVKYRSNMNVLRTWNVTLPIVRYISVRYYIEILNKTKYDRYYVRLNIDVLVGLRAARSPQLIFSSFSYSYTSPH